jgi:hypothetical protein
VAITVLKLIVSSPLWRSVARYLKRAARLPASLPASMMRFEALKIQPGAIAIAPNEDSVKNLAACH